MKKIWTKEGDLVKHFSEKCPPVYCASGALFLIVAAAGFVYILNLRGLVGDAAHGQIVQAAVVWAAGVIGLAHCVHPGVKKTGGSKERLRPNLAQCFLIGAYLSDADLRWAKLFWAKVDELTNFSRANWWDADFHRYEFDSETEKFIRTGEEDVELQSMLQERWPQPTEAPEAPEDPKA